MQARGYIASSPLGWCQHALEELALLDAYVVNVEHQLELGLMWFVKDYEERVLEEGSDHVHTRVVLDGIDSHDWDVENIYHNMFPRLHRYAVLLTLCAWFEGELNELCAKYRRALSCRVGLQDLKGSGFTRAVEYLKKAIGLEFSTVQELSSIQRVGAVYSVRNVIAHNSGVVHEANRRAMAAIEDAGGAVGVTHGVVELGDSYLGEVIARFREFVLAVKSADRKLGPAESEP